jgi:hypothetical protein
VFLSKNKGKIRPKKLDQLLKKCENVREDKLDVLCVATLSNFDYLPFAFIGVDKNKKSYLLTGKSIY